MCHVSSRFKGQPVQETEELRKNAIYNTEKAPDFRGLFYFVPMKELYQLFLASTGVSIDTRTIKEGNLFFALQGENANGRKYIPDAVKKGASGIVYTGEPINSGDANFIRVEDPLATLQNLATHHRRELDTKIIALTGSNGKTTTKELLAACLSTTFDITSTKGNLNNHIGVPLTLLEIKCSHEIAVVEMGANHQKEIEFLCNIAYPDMGFITNFGKAHLEGFGGVEGVIKGKSEMHQHLAAHDQTIFVPYWDDKQMELTEKYDRIVVGKNISLKRSEPFVRLEIDGKLYDTNLTGEYNFYNAALAGNVAAHLGVPPEKIGEAISDYVPKNNRSEIIKLDGLTIILDAYNANPSSMEKALTNLAKRTEKHKVAILGDMLEMGEYSEREHRTILERAKALDLDEIHLIGPEFSAVASADDHRYPDFEAFKQRWRLTNKNDCSILIKGSRAGKLERVVELIREQVK